MTLERLEYFRTRTISDPNEMIELVRWYVFTKTGRNPLIHAPKNPKELVLLIKGFKTARMFFVSSKES